MSDQGDSERDVALDALDSLERATKSGIQGLSEVQDHLAGARRQRRRGWSWRRILESGDIRELLPSLTRITASLTRGSAGFRRAITQSMRKEGVRTAEIGTLMGVTRQRVSALSRTQPGETD